MASHHIKDAHMAHLIKVDLKAELFSYTIDEEKKRCLELLDGKLLLVTNTKATQRASRYLSLHSCSQLLNMFIAQMCLDGGVALGVESDGADGRPVTCSASS